MYVQHKTGTSNGQGRRAKGILKDLRKQKFLKYLDSMMDETKVLSTLSKTFQSDELCITDMVTSLETTLTPLNELKLEKEPQYKNFNEGYSEETGNLQKDLLSFFKAFDPREVPQERSNLATYGNGDVKSLVEHSSNNYLIEEEETSII